jgi:hypothetical protein
MSELEQPLEHQQLTKDMGKMFLRAQTLGIVEPLPMK